MDLVEHPDHRTRFLVEFYNLFLDFLGKYWGKSGPPEVSDFTSLSWASWSSVVFRFSKSLGSMVAGEEDANVSE